MNRDFPLNFVLALVLAVIGISTFAERVGSLTLNFIVQNDIRALKHIFTGIFKNYKLIQDQDGYTMGFNKKNINLIPVILYAKSLEDFIKVSYEYELKYISINKNGVEDVFYPYLDEIYENEEKFPYLIKIFDTEQEGFEKLKAKVFEIDYKIYYEING